MADFLNWRTDPFLLDPETTPMNDWLTANKIIERDTSKITLFINPYRRRGQNVWK